MNVILTENLKRDIIHIHRLKKKKKLRANGDKQLLRKENKSLHLTVSALPLGFKYIISRLTS